MLASLCAINIIAGIMISLHKVCIHGAFYQLYDTIKYVLLCALDFSIFITLASFVFLECLNTSFIGSGFLVL